MDIISGICNVRSWHMASLLMTIANELSKRRLHFAMEKGSENCELGEGFLHMRGLYQQFRGQSLLVTRRQRGLV